MDTPYRKNTSDRRTRRPASKRKKYYAVASGAQRGIYSSWEECSRYVCGVPNAKHKSFFTYADAAEFLMLHRQMAMDKDDEHTAPMIPCRMLGCKNEDCSRGGRRRTNVKCANTTPRGRGVDASRNPQARHNGGACQKPMARTVDGCDGDGDGADDDDKGPVVGVGELLKGPRFPHPRKHIVSVELPVDVQIRTLAPMVHSIHPPLNLGQMEDRFFRGNVVLRIIQVKGVKHGSSHDACGCAVFHQYPRRKHMDIAEALPCEPFTGNRAELWALRMCIDQVCDRSPEKFPPRSVVLVLTSSTYAFMALTEWYAAWEASGHTDEKKNIDLIGGVCSKYAETGSLFPRENDDIAGVYIARVDRKCVDDAQRLAESVI